MPRILAGNVEDWKGTRRKLRKALADDVPVGSFAPAIAVGTVPRPHPSRILRCETTSPRRRAEVRCTGTFQISSAYSRMVRSEENHGIRATFKMLARVQAGTTCQRASMPRWAA